MVIGLDSFIEWFRGYDAYFVLIGGTACDMIMNEIGANFRATRDIDMVLIIEALDIEFGAHFWEYIKTAGYENRQKSNGKPIYYRFTNPKSTEFPAVIELFTRRIEGVILPADAVLTPLPFGDNIASLSAILLDDAYYELLRTGIINIDGVPILSAEYLIPFKIKAWLDLTERKKTGGQVDSKDIRKHKNDVLKLSALLLPETIIPLPFAIKVDIQAFFAKIDDPYNFQRIAAAFGLSQLPG